MSQKAKQRELGIQRKKPEPKEEPVVVPKDPNARRNLYIMIVVALAGLAIFYFIQNTAPVSAQSITPAAYQSEYIERNAPHLLVDVRTPEEFASGHIAGAVNIPLDTLADRLDEVPSDQPVVVYCRTGNRSAQAATLLRDAGYSRVLDMGGLTAWTDAGYPVE